MLRTFTLILIGISLFALSCERPPDFSETPEISYRSITNTPVQSTGLGGDKDSITISIHFQDGDGDLGLQESKVGTSPYINEYEKNYFVTTYRKQNGEFVKIDFGNLELGGRFAPLADPDITGPIEGTLNYAIEIPHYKNSGQNGFLINQGDTLKFSVYIVDRELNKSNSIETETVIYFKD